MPYKYNFDEFLSNEGYKVLGDKVLRKRLDGQSLPYYKNQNNNYIQDYYSDFTGGNNVNELENNYAPYKQFTEYIQETLKNNSDPTKINQIVNYFNWLDTNAGSGGKGLLNINRFIKDGKLNFAGQEDAFEQMLLNYSLRRNDGKFGYYHLGPIELLSPEGSPDPQPKPIPTIPPAKRESLTPEALPTDKIKSRYPGWSDWIPLTLKKIGDDMTAIRNGNLERLKKFPLLEPKYRQAIVTNDYATRQMLELQKSELRSRIATMDGSDVNQNLKNRLAVEDLVQELNNKQLLLKLDRYNLTKQDVKDTYNWNRDQSVDTANYNRKSNAAAWNWIINSKIELNEKLNSNWNTYITDMYGNYGEFLKTKRLNENAKLRAKLSGEYSDQLDKIDSDYLKLINDPFTWDGMNSFLNVLGSQLIEGLTEEQRQALNLRNPNDPTFKNAVIEILKYNTQSSIVKQYRNQYAEYIKQVENRALTELNKAKVRYRNRTGLIDLYATNQWGPSEGWLRRLFGGGGERRSVLSAKSGGRVLLLIDFVNSHEKESKSVRDNITKRNKNTQDNLNKQLDRITQEELILLRSVFK